MCPGLYNGLNGNWSVVTNVYMIMYISIFMITYGPLLAFVAGQIFNTCALHVMSVIIWIGQ